MVVGKRVALRPLVDGDWSTIEEWAQTRDGLWGPYQRFQMDHVPALKEAYLKTGLLDRDSGFLIIETSDRCRVLGFVRYTLLRFPDADVPYPEIGFGLDPAARGKGYAAEAVSLLVDYLFEGYPAERIGAFTDVENLPSQHLLEKLGFQREGVLRRSTFRDGRWCDLAAYSLLREEWQGAHK